MRLGRYVPPAPESTIPPPPEADGVFQLVAVNGVYTHLPVAPEEQPAEEEPVAEEPAPEPVVETVAQVAKTTAKPRRKP